MSRLLLSIFLAVPACVCAQEVLAPATFEDLALPPAAEWTHPEPDDYQEGTFQSGSFIFHNHWDSTWGSWAWFAYASHTDNSYLGTQDQMHCAAGGGHESDSYGVWFDSTYDGPSYIDISPEVAPCTVPGAWVCANSWLKDAVLNGDGMSDPFKAGDYCCMVVKGERSNGTWAGPVRIMLADYRSSDPEQWSILDEWQWADLSPLGDVKRLHLEFFSTKRNGWGITTPSFACIDDLGAPEPGSAVSITPQVKSGVEIIDMQGTRIYSGDEMPQLPAGIYIVKQAGKITKIHF